MTKDFIILPADSTGKRAETIRLAHSAASFIHREVLAFGGTTIGAIADVLVADPTASSPGVVVRVAPNAVRQIVLSPTAASFNVSATISSARVDHSLVVSPTAASFLVTVAGAKTVLSPTAASFNVTVSGLTSAIRNVTSLTAASFLDTAMIPGYVRAKSDTAASFLATITAPGYVRAQSATAASFAVVMPGAKTVLSPTAASFNVTVANLTSAIRNVTSITAASFNVTVPGAKTVLSATAASFLANVNVLGTKRVQSDTAASFLANVTVLGTKRVQSDTAASFLVTVAGAKNVLSVTAASFNVNSTRLALSPTAASFLVTVAGAKNVLSVTAASFNVTVAGAKNVLSVTAASFNVAAINLFTARSTWPTIETNNSNATAITDLSRRLIVANQTFPEKTLSTVLTVSLTVPIAVFGATVGERNYISTLMASNSSGTATRVDFFDRTTAGRKYASAYIAASGGGFALPISDVDIRGNTNSTVVVRVTPTVASVLVTAVGYSAP